LPSLLRTFTACIGSYLLLVAHFDCLRRRSFACLVVLFPPNTQPCRYCKESPLTRLNTTAEVMPMTTFFSLPTELRLQIAAYAVQQPHDVGIRKSHELRIDPKYDAASNLSLLLVCRQFKQDFTDVAYQATKFIIVGPKVRVVTQAPASRLRNLRKVVVSSEWSQIETWEVFPFNQECMVLEELCIVAMVPTDRVIGPFVKLLRRLQNVKNIRMFPSFCEYRLIYGRLVGAMYKDDHYHRYDAPDAPSIRDTWWQPHFNAEDISFDFAACPAEPPMAEEDYMVMMKPKIDEIMEWMNKWSALRARVIDV
jgi:hypothetical protein